MNLTSLPLDPILERDANGKATGELHPTWKAALNDNNLQMQRNLSDYGYTIPQQPTTTISQLNLNNTVGLLVYDKITHELKININGTFKVIQVV